MNLLILRTDIKTKKKVNSLKSLFNDNPVILRWNVDLDDVDNVLRIEAKDELQETEVIQLVKQQGFFCEALPD